MIFDDIAAEVILSGDIDGPLAVHRATALFLNVLEDYKPGAVDCYMRVLEHVCQRMR